MMSSESESLNLFEVKKLASRSAEVTHLLHKLDKTATTLEQSRRKPRIFSDKASDHKQKADTNNAILFNSNEI